MLRFNTAPTATGRFFKLSKGQLRRLIAFAGASTSIDQQQGRAGFGTRPGVIHRHSTGDSGETRNDARAVVPALGKRS